MNTILSMGADRLLARGTQSPEVDLALAQACEVLYFQSETSEGLERFRSWLEPRVEQAPALRPWLALVHLAGLSTGERGWQADLALLDQSLARLAGRPGLVLQTEAAFHLYRLSGDASAAWERLRSAPLPDPTFGEAAAESVVVRLRLAGAAGDWEGHDQLAAEITPAWEARAGSRSIRISLALAENAILRGAYEGALGRVRLLEDYQDAGVRLAALELGLHIRIACGGTLPGKALGSEIARVADLLAPLVEDGFPEKTVLPAGEWEERHHRCEILLRLAKIEEQVPGEDSSPASELVKLEAQFEAGSGSIPDIELRRRLRWVKATFELHGKTMAGSCEDVLTLVIEEASARGLLVLQMLAWDLRAHVRDHGLGLWRDAVEDAGSAANLAARLLAINHGGFLERPLRVNLLPIFDYAVELLAEGSLRGVKREEQYGKALLDYAEQSMELALSEARSRIRSEGGEPGLFPVLGSGERLPHHSEDLQSALRPGEAVLQYFLAGHFLLVFCYGKHFFLWSVDSSDNIDPAHPLPIRTAFERDLERWRSYREQGMIRDAGVVQRHLITVHWKRAQARPTGMLEEILRRLGKRLLPEQIAATLDSRAISRLIIIPHDILYRAPFGLLPWRNAVLSTRFGLSLQPTGSLAGARPSIPWKPRGERPRVGFVIGPRIAYAKREGRALAAALGRGAEVIFVDTPRDQEGAEAFVREAPGCDVLYLACHGDTPEASVEEACLQLGRRDERISLARVTSLPLQQCGLVVLQSCWTGWMVHLRENPVQGFPQALLDAGARAVIAPMVPVDDPLCPVFTAVLGRVLRFLPACEALARTLEILRRHGRALAAGDLNAAVAFKKRGGFEAFEYRFTGDPEVDLAKGRLDRFLARVRFHLWLAGQRLWRHPWIRAARGGGVLGAE